MHKNNTLFFIVIVFLLSVSPVSESSRKINIGLASIATLFVGISNLETYIDNKEVSRFEA